MFAGSAKQPNYTATTLVVIRIYERIPSCLSRGDVFTQHT